MEQEKMSWGDPIKPSQTGSNPFATGQTREREDAQAAAAEEEEAAEESSDPWAPRKTKSEEEEEEERGGDPWATGSGGSSFFSAAKPRPTGPARGSDVWAQGKRPDPEETKTSQSFSVPKRDLSKPKEPENPFATLPPKR